MNTKLKIPAMAYYRIVAQFAKARGLRFFTVKEQTNAKLIYNANAAVLN